MSEQTPQSGAAPAASEPTWQPAAHESTLTERVEVILNQIRPALQADGGDCELLEVTDDGIVRLGLHGACGSCPSSPMTLKMGIEATLKEYIPEVREVITE